MNTQLTPTTKRAILKYGIEVCKAAYHMHAQYGEGANTVSHNIAELKGNTRMADAAINAGREISAK